MTPSEKKRARHLQKVSRYIKAPRSWKHVKLLLRRGCACLFIGDGSRCLRCAIKDTRGEV